MSDQVKLSVIIPYYNKWPRTKYALESLNRQDFKEKFEVIMVDDGSTPSLNSCLKDAEVHVPLQVIEQKNGGRSAARNTGFAHAKGDIVVFVDDDVILSPDFLRSHYEKHMETTEDIFVHGRIYDLIELTSFYDPEKGIYFDFIADRSKVLRNAKPALSVENVFKHWEEFQNKKRRMSRLEKLIQEVLATKELEKIHWLGCVGGNVSMKRESFQKAGGFDTKFIYWGGEDFELGYRLLKQGVKAATIDSNIYHMTHAHVDHFEERRVSETYFYEKHKDETIKILYEFLEKNINQKELIERVGGLGNVRM